MTFAEVHEAVEHWFAERIACGEIARHTPAYNQALAAKDDLKARLGKVLGAIDLAPPLPPRAAKAAEPQSAADAAAPQE